jgi:hypothetical protein
MQQPIQVNLAELTSKFKSKREIYAFLVLDCHCYLPKESSINLYYLKGIISGKKKVPKLVTDTLTVVYEANRCQSCLYSSR